MKQQPQPTVITPLAGHPLSPSVTWMPIQKEQTTGVIARSKLNRAAGEKLIRSSAEILGSGVNPQTLKGAATGLIVGYVQSGKTLSFTTVIGLARDNGFPLVILVAGNKDHLLTQSHERLASDLDVEGGEGLPVWIMEKNARAQDSQYEQHIRRAISNWRNKNLDADEKPTVLLTVLKQNHRLLSLTALLGKLDLVGVPVLVIDDEADQASLNTKINQGQESTTYTRLRELREALPSHTLLQYTATPQALLLINIADTLSPNFVHVLQPGEGYVGGLQFFGQRTPYVKVIPSGDIPPNDALPVDPPDSLLEALRVFFVGLAASIIKGQQPARRSMLIHPARERIVHQSSVQWVTAAKEEWEKTLELPEKDPDRKELVDSFRTAHEELLKTESSLPPLDAIIAKMPRALRNTTVIEFNTRGAPKTPKIKWRNAEGWILVGGQALDRGFTVDSLSVTYMPRGIGVGNADTLQQRARFFGYAKLKGYFGICRVYLEQALKDAFTEYVEHEQVMRQELERFAKTGESLRNWRRRLILDPSLQPCRQSVILDPLMRGLGRGGWTHQYGALMTPEARAANEGAISKLVAKSTFHQDTTYIPISAAQAHEVAQDVPIGRIIEMLLDYKCENPRDTANMAGVLITLGAALHQDPGATAAVYRMRPEAASRREINQDGTIGNFLQGRTATADGGTSYPGDGFFKSDRQLTIQLHSFDLTIDQKIVASSAPVITWHVPGSLAKAWLVQLQAGQPRQ